MIDLLHICPHILCCFVWSLIQNKVRFLWSKDPGFDFGICGPLLFLSGYRFWSVKNPSMAVMAAEMMNRNYWKLMNQEPNWKVPSVALRVQLYGSLFGLPILDLHWDCELSSTVKIIWRDAFCRKHDCNSCSLLHFLLKWLRFLWLGFVRKHIKMMVRAVA